MSLYLNYKALKNAHDFHPDLTVKQLLTLMYIAENPGCTVSDVVRDLKIAQSVASKIVRVLTVAPDETKVGLDLLEQRIDPIDTRRRLLSVNEKGKAVFKDFGS